MRLRVSTECLLFAVLLGGACILPVTTAAFESLEEARGCIVANAPQRSAIQALEMKIFDRAGSYRHLKGRGHWQMGDDGLSKLLIRVEAPMALIGHTWKSRRRSRRKATSIDPRGPHAPSSR